MKIKNGIVLKVNTVNRWKISITLKSKWQKKT